MASILDHLREEHERLRHSVRHLYPVEAGVDPQEQFYQLLCQYTAYARAEERILYSYMLHVQHLRERALQGLEEHEQLDALFCRAEQTPCGCARWNATIRQLCELMSRYLREEERSLFDLARTALTGQEAAGLGICFAAERTRVYRDLVRLKETTGPHPR
ncbi:hemerythrin domain-containing protein [Nannocystis radixulma]|uniref:Hemerythrin domain-containing protein n=1 Tax=Nannocystis radixulma TaxID=2995305 RepID=A0ABT5BSM4_9BACT|nr:hemerythrin domain-containing protein [Nannocystis radixulma]MDC0675921.1 hemerythrin domain-containing protein [Nannocystis radixulma]